ncbi:MAG: diguanylate cyclase, partial [Oscillospiraceae bacterium]
MQYTDDHGQSMWIQFHTMMRGSKKITVVQDISENIREKIKLEYERDYDSLTNLRNRRSFKKIVVDILKEKDLGIGAMIMWDMDNLKYINDHYGHDTGDRYLSDAAKMFSTLNSNRGVVARMSGDEFYAFLYNFQTKEELFATVERLHNRMKQTPFVPPDGQAINIRASGGIAWLPEDSEDYDDLVKYADFAMYNVKNTCRGELMDFDREIFNRDEVLISGREALNRFIENRMFKYAFQPIVDLQSGEVFAYEALMRPDCPELPTIHEVMRLATSQSRLYQIEQLTMFGVFEAVENNIEAFNGAKIFVNSIPNTCLSTSDIKLFENKFSKYNGRMVIEIIENEQSDAACMQIKRNFAKKWNAEIALDDFGSGYSTESSLLNISPNYVKIDISIVRNVNN